MIFYLIVCTPVYLGWTCLPPQRMESLQICEFVATHYRSIVYDAKTRCLTIRGKR